MKAMPYRDSKPVEPTRTYIYRRVDDRRHVGRLSRQYIGEASRSRPSFVDQHIQEVCATANVKAGILFIQTGDVLLKRSYYLCHNGIHFSLVKRNTEYSADDMPTRTPRYKVECTAVGSCDGSCDERVELQLEDWPAEDERKAFEKARNGSVKIDPVEWMVLLIGLVAFLVYALAGNPRNLLYATLGIALTAYAFIFHGKLSYRQRRIAARRRLEELRSGSVRWRVETPQTEETKRENGDCDTRNERSEQEVPDSSPQDTEDAARRTND